MFMARFLKIMLLVTLGLTVNMLFSPLVRSLC